MPKPPQPSAVRLLQALGTAETLARRAPPGYEEWPLDTAAQIHAVDRTALAALWQRKRAACAAARAAVAFMPAEPDADEAPDER